MIKVHFRYHISPTVSVLVSTTRCLLLATAALTFLKLLGAPISWRVATAPLWLPFVLSWGIGFFIITWVVVIFSAVGLLGVLRFIKT